MTKAKWSKIKRGDVVEMSGRDWLIEKIKPKGKALRVSLKSGMHTADAKVDPDDKVKIAEAKKAPRRTVAPASSKKPTTPPKPAAGDPWETQQDRIEKMLHKTLGAVLVGEATDADVGYYVPPVDVTTVAAHLALFHGSTTGGRDMTEDELVALHARAHLSAENGGDELLQHHWHTDKRPTSGKKGKS